MRPLILLAAVLALLAFGGCGGDDEPAAEDGATGAAGTQDVSSGERLTASEFIDAPIPDQAQEVQDLVDANPDCADVNAKPGGEFQVGVAISAAQSTPGTPLEEIIADQCGQG